MITGGTPPYNVLFSVLPDDVPGTINPQVVNATGQGFVVTGLTAIPPSGVTAKPLITDSGSPAQQVIATINCQ